MDPVTHLMTGACLARTGLNRKAAYATLAMTLAAEMPDLDVVWSFRGPVAGFEHHRGITHTFVGLPFEAAVAVGVVWGIHQIRVRWARQPSGEAAQAGPVTHAPVRWGLLYVFSLLALGTHLLLDWTNNYGIRPFFPFQPRWYAGSFVFIVEPLMLFFLAGALVGPALFGLVAGEVGARRARFRGRGWAVAALLGIACLWGLRYVEHDIAVQLAANGSYGPAGGAGGGEVLRVTASPSPVNPFAWHAVVETPVFFQLATVDTRRGVVETDPNSDLLFKPPTTPATAAAKQSWLGRVYLDWSSWPLVTDAGPAPLPEAAGAQSGAMATQVTFRDLRFLYDVPTQDWRQDPPLGAEVFLDPDGVSVAAMMMSGHVQR